MMTAGPRNESGCQEAGRQDSRIPERTRLVPGQQECLDRYHRDDKHHGRDAHPPPHDRSRLAPPAVIPEQQGGGQPQCKQEIDVQHQGVPRQQGVGEVVPADERNHVPEAVRPAEVDEDVERTHDHRRQRHGDAYQRRLADVLAVVEDRGNHQHDRRGGNPAHENEIGDVESPIDLITQVRDNHAFRELIAVVRYAHPDARQQQQQPKPVIPLAAQRQLDTVEAKAPECPHT